jgi:hypothetical protein
LDFRDKIVSGNKSCARPAVQAQCSEKVGLQCIVLLDSLQQILKSN